MREKFVVFETKFITLLTSVKDDNYLSIIGGLGILIKDNKGILSKSQVLTILYKIDQELEMSELQEKLFVEVEEKIIGDYSFE